MHIYTVKSSWGAIASKPKMYLQYNGYARAQTCTKHLTIEYIRHTHKINSEVSRMKTAVHTFTL